VKGYHKSTVEYHIKDPIYYGRVRWRGQEYEGKHEKIIPDHILSAVQATLGGKRASRLVTDEHGIFGNGWLHCVCGCQIVYDPKKKLIRSTGITRVFHYYRCTNGKRAHETLAGRNVNEDHLWAEFANAVGHISINSTLAASIAKALNRQHEKTASESQRQAEAYRAHLRELERRADQVYDDLKASVLDIDAYRRQSERIKKERETIEAALRAQASGSSGKYLETAKSIFELSINAKSLWLSRRPLERRFFLERILSNPRLDGATLQYDLKKPFRVLGGNE
jgi:hypothetical protein